MKHRILLADDDPQILKTLILAFQDLDCEITTAKDGQEALQLIVQCQPSLIISDWHMPVLDGLGLFLQVKDSPITKDIPFVFLTSTNDTDIRAALLEIGVEDYWNKPFGLREIAVRAKRILTRLGSPEKLREMISNNLYFGNTTEVTCNQILNNRYKLLNVIGEGGMGRVFRTNDLVHDRIVALKLLRREFVHDETEVRRFAREAAAAMRIKHPNVIETFEFGLIPSGQAYIVMELLAGSSLAEQIDHKPFLKLSWILSVIEQVCLAIEAAHSQKVIHRDLKPTNIFIVDNQVDNQSGQNNIAQVDAEPYVKVLDFGIALLKDSPMSPLTSPNVIMGTPQYLSPEQAVGLPIDGRSDIYSLGIIIYKMLAGKLPFDGHSSLAIMNDHLIKPPKPLQDVVKIDSWLAELTMQMLAKNPEARPQSIQEIISIIRKNR